MPRKRYSPEQIITKLRQAEVELSRGLRPPQICKKLVVSEQTHYRWRKEYGGLRLDQAKRLKTLEQENARLKRLVADQALDNAILKAVAAGNFCARPDDARPWIMYDTTWTSRNGGPVGYWISRGRREGLKVPQKQPKRGRLWLTDGSCIRRRAEYRHHVWAYDFVAGRTHDGRPLKILTVVDEYSRECLALVVARRLRATDVLETLADLVVTHGVPAHIRSDNGPEFTAELVRLWLAALQVQALFIEPGSPWENGYVESFNGKLRDELLDREIFYTLTEAKSLVERWRRQYNSVRPHSALGYRPPAPEAVTPAIVDGLNMSCALS